MSRRQLMIAAGVVAVCGGPAIALSVALLLHWLVGLCGRLS